MSNQQFIEERIINALCNVIGEIDMLYENKSIEDSITKKRVRDKLNEDKELLESYLASKKKVPMAGRLNRNQAIEIYENILIRIIDENDRQLNSLDKGNKFVSIKSSDLKLIKELYHNLIGEKF